MGKWQMIYRDKDTGELQVEEVSRFIGGSQRNDELREQGHDTIGWRESPAMDRNRHP
ncbi:MAG TPA: hypothetical protein VG142_11950 [Trebonia sp.]|jgi:hypothetical protein|nr:hypothetical protein [Trebonia sp.]